MPEPDERGADDGALPAGVGQDGRTVEAIVVGCGRALPGFAGTHWRRNTGRGVVVVGPHVVQTGAGFDALAGGNAAGCWLNCRCWWGHPAVGYGAAGDRVVGDDVMPGVADQPGGVGAVLAHVPRSDWGRPTIGGRCYRGVGLGQAHGVAARGVPGPRPRSEAPLRVRRGYCECALRS